MTGTLTETAPGSDSEGPWDLFPDGVLRLPSARQQPASGAHNGYLFIATLGLL
jgi:hypothetical protein